MLNTGLYPEFQFRISENSRPDEIPINEWNDDHPLHWKTINFVQNFSGVNYDIIAEEGDRIDDVLSMLDQQPQSKNDEDASELASKQHGMWITELLENSWSDDIVTEMNAFEEETKGDGILLFFIFLREYVGYTKEAVIAAEQQLTKE
jgi:hypothetical protein